MKRLTLSVGIRLFHCLVRFAATPPAPAGPLAAIANYDGPILHCRIRNLSVDNTMQLRLPGPFRKGKVSALRSTFEHQDTQSRLRERCAISQK